MKLRHRDLEHNHGLSANQGVIIQITSPKFFPLIALCHRAYTFYRDHNVTSVKRFLSRLKVFSVITP